MKNLRYLWLSFLTPAFFSCQSSDQKSAMANATPEKVEQAILTDSCTIDGTTYSIYQLDSLSFISAQGARDTVYGVLALRPPVYIVRNGFKSSKVQAFSYPQFGADQVLMLFGEKMQPADQTERGIDSTYWCGSRIQGLIVSRDSTRLTKSTFEAYKCKGYPSDEKDYYSLAEAER